MILYIDSVVFVVWEGCNGRCRVLGARYLGTLPSSASTGARGSS